MERGAVAAFRLDHAQVKAVRGQRNIGLQFRLGCRFHNAHADQIDLKALMTRQVIVDIGLARSVQLVKTGHVLAHLFDGNIVHIHGYRLPESLFGRSLSPGWGIKMPKNSGDQDHCAEDRFLPKMKP